MTKTMLMILISGFFIAQPAMNAFQSSNMKLVRSIDFANHSYRIPERDPDDVPRFQRLQTKAGTPVSLVGGAYEAKDLVGKDWVRVNLQSVTYGDVTGDGREEALVALRIHTAGTLGWGLLLVFEYARSEEALLDGFWTGDRANEGLHKAYAQNGQLVVEVYNPEDAAGDCCPTRLSRIVLKWNAGKFAEVQRNTFSLPAAHLHRIPFDARSHTASLNNCSTMRISDITGMLGL